MTRQIAHITIEAQTPIKVGSNTSDSLQDSPIQRDFNSIPMILGTSLAGVFRSSFKGNKEKLFGDKDSSKKDAKASELIFSNALLLDENDRVNEELLLEKSDFLKLFDVLPLREHTSINDKGTNKDHSKYDEEVLYKGSRFKFSIEYIKDDIDSFNSILEILSQNSFRIGGGSSKGFGKVKVISIKTQNYTSLNYDTYSSSLNHTLANTYKLKKDIDQNFISYSLNIKADDFFMFGSGFGDIDADNTPVYESVINYDTKTLDKDYILIPASSIKGALSHRTAYYYNKFSKYTIESTNGLVGEENTAVNVIFGEKKDSKKESGKKGSILISDCFKNNDKQVKVFDHVSIDRFTGGAIDGALFQEKTISSKNEFSIEILIKDIDYEENIKKAFEYSLNDICTGMLSLGGATTKGHGIFTGNIIKNGESYAVK